jgi:peptide/nickel transport system permease protein
VFGIGGLGQDAGHRHQQRRPADDLAFVLLASAFVVIANIIVDLLYSVLDPRVRLS